ncbi:MAG: pyruvate ferredoxin oxidoreductase, partial [Deltaproteobacteria bacterium]
NVKEAIIKRTRKAFVDSNLKAFDLGFSAAQELG